MKKYIILLFNLILILLVSCNNDADLDLSEQALSYSYDIDLEFENINIYWLTGKISIKYEGDKFSLLEESTNEENIKRKLEYSISDNTLYIDYSNNKRPINYFKNLTITFPLNYKLNELNIEAENLTFPNSNLNLGKLIINTQNLYFNSNASFIDECYINYNYGHFDPSYMTGEKISINSVNAINRLTSSSYNDISVSNRLNTTCIYNCTFDNLDIYQESGTIHLRLKDSDGFILKSNKSFDTNNFETVYVNNTYYYKDLKSLINLNTKYGGIRLQKY